MTTCLELMREKMRGVRICYFIEGYYELLFLSLTLRDVRPFIDCK